MKHKFSGFIWGTFLILAAAFIIYNQVNKPDILEGISTGQIIIGVLAFLFIVQCIAGLKIAPLPIPLAILYIVFGPALGFPEAGTWTLIIASVLVSIGLVIILPGRKWFHKKNKSCCCGPRYGNDGAVEIDGLENSNNVRVNVKFGSIKRRVSSECLETVHLESNFGSLEIYFDQAQLSPDGAVVDLNCHFGSIELYIPSKWPVINKVECAAGAVEMDNFNTTDENAPRITLNGSVNFGGIEIKAL